MAPSIKNVAKKVVKAQWTPVLIPFHNGDKNASLKNLVSVTNLKSVSCTPYIEICKNFGRTNGKTDRQGCFH